MKKFCFYFPLVESGLIIGIFGIISWILYLVQAFYERNLSSEHFLLAIYLLLMSSGICFECLLMYAFIKANLFFLKTWRIYQIFLIFVMLFTLSYDTLTFSNRSVNMTTTFIALDGLFLGIEIYFLFAVRAFQKHLETIDEPVIEYHPVNEIDDDAYINDYY